MRTLQHLEAGDVRPFRATLLALLDAFELTDEDRAQLEVKARRMRVRRGNRELVHQRA